MSFNTNNDEIAALIAEFEKEDEFDNIVAEVTEPFVVEDAPEVEIEVVEEEVIEDDVLVEDRPPVELPKFNIGDAVRLTPNATYLSGSAIPKEMFNSKLYIRQVKNDSYAVGIKTTGRIAGSVKAEFVVPYVKEVEQIIAPEFNNYTISVRVSDLNVKSRPDVNSKTLKTIHLYGLYTVVGEKDNWGHLKIGGWIPLDSVKKLK